jgi:hypothetical protein
LLIIYADFRLDYKLATLPSKHMKPTINCITLAVDALKKSTEGELRTSR